MKKVAHGARGLDTYVTCDNAGSGPADIIETMISRQVYAAPEDTPRGMYLPEPPNFGPEDRQRIGDTVMRAGETGRRFGVAINFEELDGNGNLLAAICGRITYRRGPPDEIYETNFFYWYITWTEEPLLYRGPEELNRRTLLTRKTLASPPFPLWDVGTIAGDDAASLRHRVGVRC